MNNVEILDGASQTPFWQNLLQPAVLFSLGAHGLFLIAPMTGETTPPPQIKKEDKVKLTELPTGAAVETPSKSSTPALTPSTPPVANPTASNPEKSASTVPPTAKPPAPTPKPVGIIAPKPVTIPTPKIAVAPTPKPVAIPTPKMAVAPTPKITVATIPKSATPPAPPKITPFADLPKYPGATVGAFEIKALAKTSQQTPDSIAQVSGFFEREMTSLGYQPNKSINTDNKQAYQITKNGIVKFVTLIQIPGKGTVIAISDKPLPDNLGNLEVSSAQQNAFDSILSKIAGEAAEDDMFASPSSFVTQKDDKGFDIRNVKQGISGSFKLIKGQDPAAVYSSSFESNLKAAGFITTSQSAYGGGNVFEVKSGPFTRYLNLVPAKDNSGTILVVWEKIPG